MAELDGKVAVITGAGSGMGRASARVFVRGGARVLAADISGREKQTAAGKQVVVPLFGNPGIDSGRRLAGDADDLADGPRLAEHGEHGVGEVGAGDRPAAAHVPPHGGAVVVVSGLPVSCGGRRMVQSRPEPRRMSSIRARSS